MLIMIIIASLVVSTVSLIGVFFIFYGKKITQTLIGRLIAFAAGVMLTTAFLDLLPEALLTNNTSPVLLITLSGIVLVFFLERFLLWYHHHHQENHGLHPSVWLILFGDSLHNFIDGLSIAAAFLINPSLGIITSLTIIAHEIPQELADYSVFIHQGLGKKRALKLNFFSALTALMGGILGFYFFSVWQELIPYVIALTAGIFIYIANADLIPELHGHNTHKTSLSQSLFFIFGIGLIFLLTRLFSN
jgi:zinc and cadmium transporter